MALHNDLRWVDDELLEEEEAETSRPRLFRRTQKAESYGEREVIYVEKTKRKREKGIRRLKFLAFLEALAILAIIWGWIQWLY